MAIPYRPRHETQTIEVGVDLGSTYSGAAFSITSALTVCCNAGEVYDVAGYNPGARLRLSVDGKVPTLLRYEKRPKGPFKRRGHEVESMMRSTAPFPGHVVKLFKQGLDRREQTRDKRHDIEETLSLVGKSINEVVVDFYTPFLKHIKYQIGLVGYHSGDNVHFTVTVPAAWRMEAKRTQELAFQTAKLAAGFAAHDSVTLCSEPEAAAAYVIKKNKNLGLKVKRLKPYFHNTT